MSISLVIFSCVHFVLFPFPFQTPVGITALRCLPSECAGDGVLLTETFYTQRAARTVWVAWRCCVTRSSLLHVSHALLASPF